MKLSVGIWGDLEYKGPLPLPASELQATINSILGLPVKLIFNYSKFSIDLKDKLTKKAVSDKRLADMGGSPYLLGIWTKLREGPWETPPCKATVQITPFFPQNIIDVLKNFITVSSLNGILVFLARNSLGNTWSVAVSPWGMLQSVRTSPTSPTFLEQLIAKITSMQMNGETSFGVETEEDEETGSITRKITPFLELMAAPMMAKLKEDIRMIDETPVVFTNDPLVRAYVYFPLDTIEKEIIGNCDAWKDFEAQMPTWAIKPWRASFYGTFNDKNRSKQITILMDEGGTGKSNMFRAIAKRVSSEFYCPVSKDSFSNQFWGSKVFGKRLIVVSDSGNRKLTQMDKFKQLSGGDPIDVEFKGLNNRIQFVPNCRIWVSTNFRPEVHVLSRNQMSRILFIPLTPTRDEKILQKFCATDTDGKIKYFDDGSPMVTGAPYDKWMADQFFDYLLLCKESYNELCPNDGEVIVPQEMIDFIQDGCASQEHDTLKYIMDVFLIKNPTGNISNDDLRSITKYANSNMGSEDNHPTITLHDLSEHLMTLNYKKNRTAYKRGFDGISLRPEWRITGETLTRVMAPTISVDQTLT